MVTPLLAVDLGLRTGLAFFDAAGALVWYRSRHFGTRDSLRRGVHGLLDTLPDLRAIVLEGGGPLAVIWLREAERRGLNVLRVAAEDWRVDLLPLPALHERARAKFEADRLARRVIAASNAPRPTSLRHDAAEAILIGTWAIQQGKFTSTDRSALDG